MALVADDPRALEARSYFSSLGELASKIVQESDAIRNRGDWQDLNYQQKEYAIDRHFVDESVTAFYASADRSSTALGAASAGGGAEGRVIGDLPTWEMLYPRPLPVGAQKFVHVGSGEDGESSAPSYLDEFAGNFQWETRSQLEIWLPEGQNLPSPRSVRKSMFKDDSRSRLDPPRFSKVTSAATLGSSETDGMPTSTSVKALAQALQRTGQGKLTPSSGGSRPGGGILAPLPSASPATTPTTNKPSPGILRSQSTSQTTKTSPDVAPKPPKRSSSIVAESSPVVKPKSSGVLAGPPPSKSSSFESAPIDTSGGKSPRPSPPVRRDSLSKKTGSPYAASAAAADDSGYTPGEPTSTQQSSAVAAAATAPAPSQAQASSSAASYSPKVNKPQHAPPPAPVPAAAATSLTSQTPPAGNESPPSSMATSPGIVTTGKETIFPASHDSLDDDFEHVVGFANTKELSGGKGFDFLSNW